VRPRNWLYLDLTVRFPAAGTADGTVTRTLVADTSDRFPEGGHIEIVYDPEDPSNFEPAR
jgi:hypothetical protein